MLTVLLKYSTDCSITLHFVGILKGQESKWTHACLQHITQVQNNVLECSQLAKMKDSYFVEVEQSLGIDQCTSLSGGD